MILQSMTDSELFSYAKQLQVPIDLLRETAKLGRLPVVNFAAGGLGNYLSCLVTQMGPFIKIMTNQDCSRTVRNQPSK